MTKEYDLVVLGGGTGGYVAAIRAAQLGMEVAVIEAEKLGGTCLHQGCIPSKALLRSAEVFRTMKSAEEFGIRSSDVTFDMHQAQKRKSSIVDTLYNGVQGLMKKHQIDVINGFGRILGPSIFSPLPGTISVEYENGQENTMIIPKYVLIATGSVPREIPGLGADGQQILTTDHALAMTELPASMLLVGGGVIGMEWASMLTDFGVDVTVMEAAQDVLLQEDAEVREALKNELTNRGVQFKTNTHILPEATRVTEEQVTVEYEQNGESGKITVEKVLVSIGRKANIDQIGLKNTSIEQKNGYLQTNDVYQTKEPHIYAIGDCIGGMQLAHVASYEGKAAVEHMAGKTPVQWKAEEIPACIYTHPEVARIGMTEEQAKKSHDIQVGKMPFQSIGKAHVHGDVTGFAKVISDKNTKDILGVHLIGAEATELIAEAGLAKSLDATAWEIAQTVHAHPTLAEIFAEAAMAVDRLQIHG